MMSERYESLMKRIHAGENILLDGATGSELENRGIKMDNSWCVYDYFWHSVLLNDQTL